MRIIIKDYKDLFLGSNRNGTKFPEWWFMCMENPSFRDAYDILDWEIIQDLIILADEVLREEGL